MATIPQFLPDENVFDSKDILAMSLALDDISNKLKLENDSAARAVLAARIIDLARSGERNSVRLCNRVIQEANMPKRRAWARSAIPKYVFSRPLTGSSRIERCG